MRNRERYITHRNEFDLMMEISENISGMGTWCAIEAVSGSSPECKTVGDIRDCEGCVQEWLNEEAEE